MSKQDRRAREKEMRRSAIVDAAEAVFFKKGRENATMDDVAEKAELSKGLIYHYFEHKDDLYHAIAFRGMQIMERMFVEAAASRSLGIDQTEAIGRAYIAYSRLYPDYFSASFHFEAQPIEKDKASPFQLKCMNSGTSLIGIVAQAISMGIQDGSIRADLDPLKSALTLWGATHGLITLVTMKNFREDTSEITTLFPVTENELFDFGLAFIRSGLEPRDKSS